LRNVILNNGLSASRWRGTQSIRDSLIDELGLVIVIVRAWSLKHAVMAQGM
jgi:hypothetical protein